MGDEQQEHTACKSKTRLVVAYTDRIVRLFTWQESAFTTPATFNGGLASPFEEIHFNLSSSEAPAAGNAAPASTTTTADAASVQGKRTLLEPKLLLLSLLP